MKTLCLTLLCWFAVLLLGESARATDLEMTIRPYAQQVVFGDPLFIEVTIVNHGKDVAFGPTPDFDLGTFRFEIRDSETDLLLHGSGGGGFVGLGRPVEYPPGKSVKHYWYVFLPKLRQSNHTFWKPIRTGKSVSVCGVYRLSPSRTEIRSQWHDVRVAARDDDEMRTLEFGLPANEGGPKKGPGLDSFGLQLGRKLDRKETLELSGKVKSGELLDLFQLTVRMQEIYAAPRDSREAGDRALVELLKKFPDIKRQALTKHVLVIAEAYNMPSTLEALQALSDSK